MSSRGGLRSSRHSSRCRTASKLIVPRCKASSTAPVTSIDEKVSSRRSTCTYSRPPWLLQPGFQQSPQGGEGLGQLPAGKRRGLVQRPCLLFEQRQIVQRVVDHRLAFIAAWMAG